MTHDEIMNLSGLALRKAVAKAKGWEECWEKDCPHWESDIAAAWSLLEEIRERDRALRRRYKALGDHLVVEIDIFSKGTCCVDLQALCEPPTVCCGDDGLEPTICRAYLLTKEAFV